MPIEKVPFVVAHESIHYQQKYSIPGELTLLQKSINEGAGLYRGAYFRRSRESAPARLRKPDRGRALERVQAGMRGTDATNWLYQGNQAKDRPADLGYYMGYKITESYYKNAKR